MFCGHCGKQNPDNAKSCSNCGKQFDKTQFTRENTERIRLNNTQRIPKKEITQKIVMAVPPKKKQKKNNALIICCIALLLFFILIATILSFKFWTDQDDKIDPENMQNNGLSVSSSNSGENNNLQSLTMKVQDWIKYDGNWSAGGYEFSLETDDNTLRCTMKTKDDVYSEKATLVDGQNSVSVELNDKKIRFVPIEDNKLRIFIDRKQYDAIRTNSLPPDSENSKDKLINDGNQYIFYSSSSGTRTQDGNLKIEDYDQQFWPLDKFAISTDDLDRLTKSEIEIILNEAFARHGYEFNDSKWSEFFSKFSWYKPDKSFDESEFTKLEKQNIDTITQYEHDKGWT